jgi:phosphoketolase
VVTSSDGTEASAMRNVVEALGIRHPTEDAEYSQRPKGTLYEPVNEDACAGLAAALALLGGRSAWLCYESFAVNGLPILQTVTQAMAELRRRTPSAVAVFTAGALEQGRNGWTHQRPEVESYLGALVRNGNFRLLYPCDANTVQAAYEYALGSWNKGVAIIASKSPLPVYLDLERARRAVAEGAVTLHDAAPGPGKLVVLAAAGDMILEAVMEARDLVEAAGHRVRVVAVISPRRLYRPRDVAWDQVAEPDGEFMEDDRFEALFGGDVLLGVAGGSSAPLEPVLLRSRCPQRDLACWRRGETTAGTGGLLAVNGLTGSALAARALSLIG